MSDKSLREFTIDRRQLGKNIRLFRMRAGLLQVELAPKIPVSLATLRRWEAGITSPKAIQIMMLADALGIEASELVHYGSDSDKSEKCPFQAYLSCKKSGSNVQNSVSVQNASKSENKGALIYEDKDIKISLPPTGEGYELLRELIRNRQPGKIGGNKKK